MLVIHNDETLDDLNKINGKILQKKEGFRFAIDAVLIANFIQMKKLSNVLDIGTGSGIIPLLLSKNKQVKEIYGIEIQDKIYDMACRSIDYNLLNEKIKIRNEDIKDFECDFKFDIIVTNPPYMKFENGKISTNQVKAISRHELKLKLEDLIVSAKRLLKSGGSFNIIYRTNRFQELMDLLTKYKFNIKRIRFIYSKPEKDSGLFMVEAIRDKKIEIKIMEPIYIFDKNGNYTKEVLEYY